MHLHPQIQIPNAFPAIYELRPILFGKTTYAVMSVEQEILYLCFLTVMMNEEQSEGNVNSRLLINLVGLFCLQAGCWIP